ncbi:MAG: ABC transporter permease [Solirubrobacterales bacterium]|nr:ABC transporter permease [Solirubrobacterales bacterium]
MGTSERTPNNRMKANSKVVKIVLGVVVGVAVLCVYVFLYAPMMVTALFSVNDSTIQTLPFQGFTTKWYSALFNDEAMKSAIYFSLKVAAVAVTVSAVAGLGFALLVHRLQMRGTGALQGLIAAPLVAPGLVLGISLLVVFRQANVSPGFWTIVAGHAAFITPLIMFILIQRLKTADPSLEQASMDCGAGYIRTFWHVTLPGLRVALIAGCLLGFTLSMDEIAVTFFLAGTEPTLPVYVWGLLRFGFTPEVNAAFTLIAGGSLLLLTFAGLLLYISGRRQRAGIPNSIDQAEGLGAIGVSTAPSTTEGGTRTV